MSVEQERDAALQRCREYRDAVAKIVEAITNEGSHPEYHREIVTRHRREWPVLWLAIMGVCDVYER